MRSTHARVWIALACITAAAGALRFWGLSFGLPQLVRPDEEAIVTVAGRVLRIGFNPGFFDYPTFFMYIVAFAEKLSLGGAAELDDLRPFLIARALSATLGTLSVPLLFAITRRLYSTRTGLVAATLLAVSFLHVRDSHFGVTDVPAAFMTLVAFAAIVFLVFGRPTWPTVLLAAILCGVAASTKYNAGPIVLSLVAAIAVSHERRKPLLYALAVVGSIAGFLVATPYAWIARDTFVADFSALSGRMAGDRALNAGIGWIHHLTFSLWYGVGPLFLFAAIAGVAVTALSRDRWRAAVVLSFPVLYYLAMGGGHLVYMRYMVPLAPFAALLAAIAIDGFARRMIIGGGAVAALLTAVIGFSSASRAIALDRLLTRTDSRVTAEQYIKGRFPNGVSLLQTGSPYGQVRLWPEGIFPNLPLDQRPRLIVIQTSPLTSFSGVPPTLRADIAGSYRLVQRIDVEDPSSPSSAVFDQEDAFYAPVAGFDRYVLPGPTIEIFERTPY